MKKIRTALPKFAAFALVPLLAAGCSSKDASSVSSPGGAQTPPAASSAGDIDGSMVPTTTIIDGKTVPLKFMPGGLKYYDTVVGTGPSPKQGQTASMQYTGMLLNGTEFDSTKDHGGTPFDFPLGEGKVIAGWDEGVATMKVGGKRRLVIPSTLAYGANPPTPTIPPNSTLVFDVELVGVK